MLIVESKPYTAEETYSKNSQIKYVRSQCTCKEFLEDGYNDEDQRQWLTPKKSILTKGSWHCLKD